MQKLTNIQHLRAIAALIVLVSHQLAQTISFADKTKQGFAGVSTLGTFGVDIFFVISGFIMYYTSGDEFGIKGAPRLFAIRRLIRIVPIFWLLTFVEFSILFISRLDDPLHQVSFSELLKSLLFIPYVSDAGKFRPVLGVGWTLNYEMFFYVVFCVSMFLPKKLGLMALALLMSTFVAVGYFMPLEGVAQAWTMPILLEFLLGVGLGVLFKAGYIKPGLVPIGCLLPILAVVVGQEVFVTYPEGHHEEMGWRPIYWLLAVLIVCLGLICRPSEEKSILTKTLTKIGDSSYSLYLFHSILGPLALHSLVKSGVGHLVPASLFFLLSIFGLIMASWIFHRTIERPITSLLTKSLIRRERALPAPQPAT